PISCIVANQDILGVFEPGSHGSTFGGNPLACAVSRAALEVLAEEKLANRSLELGTYMIDELKKISTPITKEDCGKGLLIGIELIEPARPYSEAIMEKGLICKETHVNVIRFAPPLIIDKKDLTWAIEQIKNVLQVA